jgi:hypothetical protein
MTKGTCKLAAYTEQGRIVYSCDDIREQIHDLLNKFRLENGTDHILKCGSRDEYYEEYCMQLQNFLDQCKCEISPKCDKCPPEDHEGCYCRCEMRNIMLAKQYRERGLSSWCKDHKHA